MDKADWIILRLVTVMVQGEARLTLKPDVQRSVLYLHKKYGKKHLFKCIDALHAERGAK